MIGSRRAHIDGGKLPPEIEAPARSKALEKREGANASTIDGGISPHADFTRPHRFETCGPATNQQLSKGV